MDRYKTAPGKSAGSQSLYDHYLACVDVALRVARLAGEEPGRRLDRLVFATFVHDVGKLDPNFQAMLEATASSRPLPNRRVKHEASTFDYDHPRLVKENMEYIRKELKAACGYNLDLANLEGAMDHIWAFAVSHHGLFYVSFERARGVVCPLIRRQWTSFYPSEERRITLVDLLFEYHPLGGLVMIADLVASYCHEQGRDYTTLFGQVATIGQLLNTLIGRAREIANSMQSCDPLDYSLLETLCLLAGAIC
jgi:hypothetical protein